MLRHTFILIYRNFKRFKSTFFINLIGLTTGISCALLIYLWVNDELKKDKFHENDARLFQVMENQDRATEVFTTTSTPGLLAEALIDEIPEVELAIPASEIEDYTLSANNKNVQGAGQFVGKDYFDIFSYPLLSGDKHDVLMDVKSIAISETLAKNLFNTSSNVIGKVIQLDHKEEYIISGVFKNIPSSSSIQFDFVLSFEKYKQIWPWVLDWENNGPETYILVKEGTDISNLNKKIKYLVKEKGGEQNVSLFAKRYSENYLFGKHKNGIEAGGRITYVKLFSLIAIFILLIACINFMNLSTAKAAGRVKDVGIKKAVGARRRTIVMQYLGESLMMSFLSLMLALLIVDLLLPSFNTLTAKSLILSFDPTAIAAFAAIALVTGIIAGSYPAFYLSAFSPASVLKGKLTASLGDLWARKGLVVFQFAVSAILIVSVIVVYQQIEFIRNENAGYNKDNLIYFHMKGDIEANLETFLNQLKHIPGVVNASSIGHSLVEGGYSSSTSTMQWEGKNPDEVVEFERVRVNYGMIETLDVTILEGRSFSPDFGAEENHIIVNEAGIEVMGMKDPVGKVVKYGGEDKQIIGVAKNFHFESMHEQVKPLFFIYNPSQTWLIMARIDTKAQQQTIASIQKVYRTYGKEFSFDYKFLDDDYQAQYAAEHRVATLSKYFAALAIIISCLGLLGLAAFTAERRMKEIGIRKVLGSSTISIMYLLSADFTKMVITAIIIAVPVSYYFASQWLETFAYKISLNIWHFAAAGALALVTAWLTVAAQTFKAARINPTACLKNE